jgi:multicomponent Na+:H+ antiporter subunit E
LRKFLYYMEFSAMGSLVWCILYEEVTPVRIAVGLAAGLAAVIFADGFLMSRERKKVYYINPFVFIAFMMYVLYYIFRSGIQVIPLILTGKTNTGIVKINTSVDKGLMTSIIANAITLTPGTVTIDKKGNQLTVLWISVKTRDSLKAGEMITGSMEKILMKGYKK